MRHKNLRDSPGKPGKFYGLIEYSKLAYTDKNSAVCQSIRIR